MGDQEGGDLTSIKFVFKHFQNQMIKFMIHKPTNIDMKYKFLSDRKVNMTTTLMSRKTSQNAQHIETGANELQL